MPPGSTCVDREAPLEKRPLVPLQPRRRSSAATAAAARSATALRRAAKSLGTGDDAIPGLRATTANPTTQ
eukprot:357606-Chlamydomonas_euryale.AAC.5